MEQMVREKHDLSQSSVPGHALVLSNLGGNHHETFSSVFTALGFYVQTCENLSVEEIRTTLHECADLNHKQNGCLVVVILTTKMHGGKLLATDRTYNTNEIITPFINCDSLRDKPKIFFFVMLEENITNKKFGKKNELELLELRRIQSLRFPKETDFLIMQNTVLQKELEEDEFSIYVQCVCDLLITWSGGKVDLVTLLTEVNMQIINKNKENRYICNQIPCIMSSLQYNLVLSYINSDIASPLLSNFDSCNLANFDTPGLVLLFNQYEFDDTSVPRREGSHCDAAMFTETFMDLNFNIKTFTDLSVVEISNNLKYYSESEDLTSYGCLVVIMMTRGEMGMMWAKDKPYEAYKIWEPFVKTESLSGKPKIFIYQIDRSFETSDDSEICNKLKTRHCTKQELILPSKMDMLFLYSPIASADKSSSSTLLPGSLFTQIFCKILVTWRHNDIDLLSMLTLVNKHLKTTSERIQLTSYFISSLSKLITFSVMRPAADMMIQKRTLIIVHPQEPEDVLPEPEFSDNIVLKLDDEIETEEIKPQMFGLMKNAKEIVKLEFREVILKNNVQLFTKKLNKYRDNIKFLGKYLLQQIYSYDRDELMETLLCHDLPQEELLYLLWRTITDSDCSREMFEKVCSNLNYLLRYHMDFSHRYSEESNTPIGFPILCVLKTCNNEKNAKEKIQMLISNGAKADSRYKPNDEETPIHFAAVNNMWYIVQFLLKENVNIDLKIKGKITRSIIATARPEFFQNNIYTVAQTLLLQEQLFDALYLKDEEKFIQLLRQNKLYYIDININDGRNTLLQLAIQNKCAKVGKELLENCVDLSAMAGNCVEPISLVLQNSEFELLELFALNASRLNLKFSSNGSTFLHVLATQCSKVSVQKYNKMDLLYILVKEAIKQEIHISAIDKYNKTAIEICIESSNNILCNILLNNGSFLTLNGNIVNKIEPDLLTKYFDEKIRISSSSVQLNYDFMQPLQSCYNNNNLVNGSIIVPEMLPLLEICKSEKLHEVLLHPILTFFLIYKWKQIAFIYILNFLLYVLFTMCFSLHIFSNLESIKHNITNYEFQRDENNGNIGIYINFFITLFLWCFLIIREIFQIITSFNQYKSNPENYLEILMLIVSFLTFIPVFYKTRFIPACAVALIYIELTLLIGRHPFTETYITMFVRVALKTIKLLFIFSSFIFAFAFGFYIFFYSLNNEDLFSDLWHSVLRTSVMSAGEFSIDDIKFYLSPGLSELMFILFLVFVPIVLMNLLNALAISDTQQIIDETNILCCLANIKHYTKIESMLLGYSRNNPGERCYGYVPDTLNKKLFSIIKRLTKSFGTIFRVNLLPFNKNEYILNITLQQNNEDKNLNVNLHTYIHNSCSNMWKYFYYTVLLRGNEISYAKQLVKKRLTETKNNDATELKNEIKCNDNVVETAKNISSKEMDDLKQMLNHVTDELRVIKCHISAIERCITK